MLMVSRSDPNTRESIDYDLHAYLEPRTSLAALTRSKIARSTRLKTAVGLHAGSYGGYNRWREQLAELAGYPAGDYEQYGRTYQSHCVPCWNGEAGPFSELINFSDCEGVIGASVSAKLAKDFADFQPKADAHEDDRFRMKYAEWRQAFEMASDSGAVDFH